LTRYRVMHFSPDPFNGARWPFAAIVERDGGVEVARSGHLPGPDCLGGENAAGLLRWMVDQLAQVDRFDRAPTSFGTSVLLDTAVSLPAGVADPVRWVEEHVLPRAPSARSASRPRAVSLAAAGMRFFEAHQVRPWVRPRFDPQVDWPVAALRGTSGLARVSHFTRGGAELLLMEPIEVVRVHGLRDLQEPITKIQAYRGAIDRSGSAGGPMQTVFYLLAHNDAERCAKVRDQLADAAHRVVDTNIVGEREALLADIRRIGQLRAGELPLDSGPEPLH